MNTAVDRMAAVMLTNTAIDNVLMAADEDALAEDQDILRPGLPVISFSVTDMVVQVKAGGEDAA